MAISTEELALSLLAELKKEWEVQPSLFECRTLGPIATEVMESHEVGQQEMDNAVRHLLMLRAVQAGEREGQKVCLPSVDGLALLASREKEKAAALAAHEKETAWTLDRKMALAALVLSTVAILLSLLAYIWPRS